MIPMGTSQTVLKLLPHRGHLAAIFKLANGKLNLCVEPVEKGGKYEQDLCMFLANHFTRLLHFHYELKVKIPSRYYMKTYFGL